MSKVVTILGFAGSLRKNSYNKALLRAAAELMPKDGKLEIFDLEGIPPFNQDLEHQPTERVKEFKAKIKAADAILIATPEYNYSIRASSRTLSTGLRGPMEIIPSMGNPSL